VPAPLEPAEPRGLLDQQAARADDILASNAEKFATNQG